MGYLDAPVSGGVERALDATLTIMTGGTPEDFDRALPVLGTMGSNVHRIGPAGQGAVVKLVNQLLVAVQTLAACEGVLLGMRSGVDPAQLLDVLGTSWGASTMLTRTGPSIVSGDYGSRAPMRLLIKDLTLVQEVAEELGMPLPLGERTRALMDEAIARGMGEVDIVGMAAMLDCSAPKV